MTDTRSWRVGTHYGIHGYSDGDSDHSEPLFTALRPEIATQIIEDHNFLHGNGNATKAGSVQALLEHLGKYAQQNNGLTEEVAQLKRRLVRVSRDLMRAHGTISRLRTVIDEELPDEFMPDEADCT